jgi:hypothetical protein
MYPVLMIARNFWLPLAITVAAATNAIASPPNVEVLRLPDHGMQPRIALADDGSIHLTYLTGHPQSSDVQYQRRPAEAPAFSAPVRVNSESGSAIASGAVRGCDIALENSRVHIIWNGSAQTSVKIGGKTAQSSPVLYSHSDDGKAFTPQTNLMHTSWYLDGGASIAATAGRISVLWHAADGSKPSGEENRGVFLTTSTDRGQTFSPELRLKEADDGACACCGLHAFSDRGRLAILYRRAAQASDRDECFLLEDAKGSFNRTLLDPWPIRACPMTTADAFVTSDAVLLAWETQGQVYVGRWTGKLETKASPPGDQKRKHPRVTARKTGEVLLVWTETPGWGQGGNIAWQEFDKDLKPIEGGSGHAENLPAWGTAAAWPTKTGFAVIY